MSLAPDMVPLSLKGRVRSDFCMKMFGEINSLLPDIDLSSGFFDREREVAVIQSVSQFLFIF